MATTDSQAPATPNETFELPASYSQQRLWFLDRLEAGSAAYNVPSASRLRGPLDVGALERAWNVLIERHESLRTSFRLADGVPVQVVRPARPFGLEVIDVSGEPDAEERGLALAHEQAIESFDLERDELFRCVLIRLGEEDHILSFTLHHVITDAWSMGVIGRELAALYGGFVADEPVELPELQIQYGDYAVWQQQWMESGGLDQQLAYWRESLGGAPPLLELPTDRARPSEQSFRGHTIRTVLDRDVLDGVKALGEREGTTMFMTLLAAYTVMLARYSGQDDVVVATPVANRGRIELEPIVGFLVNTLALRVDLDGDPTFSELLARVRQTSLDGFTNQDLPFEKLVQELNPQRDQSHAPLAQVLFVVQNTTEGTPTMKGLERERIAGDRATAKFDLALFAGEVSDGLRVAIEYCSDLFEASTIERMLLHFEALLRSVVENPGAPISELSMLGPGELADAGAVSAGSPSADLRPVHELVADQISRTPGATAVRFGSVELTYSELGQRAEELAVRLRAHGVGPDVVVAISAERSLDTAVAVLAVLRAGGAYAPVDPNYPPERMEFMLKDSGARLVLTQRHLAEVVSSAGVPVLCLDEPAEGSDGAAPAPPGQPSSVDDLGYVIYTSGSTGWPKGVAMPHRVLANLLAWQEGDWRAEPAARTLQFASLSFDVAFQELFTTWTTGGTLVLIDDETRRDSEALARAVERTEIERLFLPFVALQSFCEAAERLDLTLPALREVITAGEQLKITPQVRRFFTRHPSCTLFNQYGPSETHVVTRLRLEAPSASWPALPSIGQPISGACVYVLDRHLRPAPVGVPGELYAGGVCVARGYLGRDELTAERFVPDPFVTGGVMYKTGDLARRLESGEIAFQGRADDQVKLRGFRVELGEVETTLTQHPLVSEAAAVLHEDRGGDVPRLIAYAVVREGAEVSEADLLTHLRGRLPEYMVPQRVAVLTELPLTPSGKLNRGALPALGTLARDTAGLARPETDLERELTEIWKRLLDVNEIGLDENFFDLGGHSLLAVQVVGAVEDELGRTCTLPMLFRNGTIRALATELQAGGADAVEPTVLQLSRGTGAPMFCICGVHVYQELAEELAPDYTLYGIFLPLEQDLLRARRSRFGIGKLTVPDMAARYAEVVRQHQPQGPYLLLGFCFGGVLAYEVAQLLRQQGEEVALLSMLDSSLASLMGRDVKVSFKVKVLRWTVRHHRLLPRRLQRYILGSSWDDTGQQLETIRARIYGDAMARYAPGPYDGASVLIRPRSSARAYEETVVDDSWGWRAIAPRLEVATVEGAHQTHLRRPFVRSLARELAIRLDRVGGASAPEIDDSEPARLSGT